VLLLSRFLKRSRRHSERFGRYLGALLFLAVVYFVAKSGLEMSSSLQSAAWGFHPGVLAISGACVLAGYLNRFGVWWRVSTEFGVSGGEKDAAKVYFLSTLGKYIPGKVGLIVARAKLSGSMGRGRTVVSTVVEYGASFAAAATLALVGAMVMSFSYGKGAVALIAGIVIMLAAIHPSSIRLMLRIARSLSGKPLAIQVPPYRTMLMAYLGLLLTGLLNGLALLLLMRSVSGGVTLQDYLPVTGAYYLASVGGLVAIFAPGGLGVREGILLLLLPSLVSDATAVSTTAMMRVLSLLAELVLAALSALIARIGHTE
jgi:hypothetical protein